MNVNEIKEKLKSEEYNFLRENNMLKDNIILLTCGGSHAYGTNTETSDLDIRGIAVEPKEVVLGLANFEQFINTETDTTIYGLRKLFSLIMNCNPNTIELLGTKEDQLFICTEEGKMIRDNIGLFLSKKAIGSFGGYARQQLYRLKNGIAQNSNQSEKESHIKDTLKRHISYISERYKEINESEFNLYVDKSEKENLDSEVFVDINLMHYPIRDLKNLSGELTTIIKDYDKVGHRNDKKDLPHLLKHSMHLIRLLIMGAELFEGKGVNTYRENDKEFLLDIRNGKYSFDEIFEFVDKYDKAFKYAADNTSLPNKPDYHKIEELLMSIYEKRLFNK